VYKKLLFLAGTKFVACLLASDFPSENPRTQTRNFPYTNTLPHIHKMTENKIQYFMREAILEGRKALSICTPNPPVGCIIISDEKIISRGHTNEKGIYHAEAIALEKIKNLGYKNLTMFVTLEPCSFLGKTPSCAKTIVQQTEIRNIYVGIIDPHPKNQGKGINILTEANIDVKIGILKDEIYEELNNFLIRED
jgi:pyrimidine deaminase RibD-like protein